MKKFLFSAIAALALFGMSSCSTVKSTSSTLDVEDKIESVGTADLVISDTKIEYTLKPSKAIRRGGEKNAKATAVKEALKANGNADVLIAPQFEIKRTRNMFGYSRIKYVKVTGYPATYKNFTVVK